MWHPKHRVILLSTQTCMYRFRVSRVSVWSLPRHVIWAKKQNTVKITLKSWEISWIFFGGYTISTIIAIFFGIFLGIQTLQRWLANPPKTQQEKSPVSWLNNHVCWLKPSHLSKVGKKNSIFEGYLNPFSLMLNTAPPKKKTFGLRFIHFEGPYGWDYLFIILISSRWCTYQWFNIAISNGKLCDETRGFPPFSLNPIYQLAEFNNSPKQK